MHMGSTPIPGTTFGEWMLVFVYGTLKKGFGNHALLKDAVFLGPDYAPGSLYATSAYPLAKKTNENRWIKGEVYKVTEKILKDLDWLEGHPNLYCRENVQLKSGTMAQMYYYQRDVSNRSYLPNGEWPQS